ncbi:hypothetical protein UFOVP695_39, partial [uncultured Caudovirales phage]
MSKEHIGKYGYDFKGDSFVRIGRAKKFNFSLNKMIEISKDYKHIYKASGKFRKVNFDGRYVLYIFSNIEISDEVIDYLNFLEIIRFINNLYIISLYNIK